VQRQLVIQYIRKELLERLKEGRIIDIKFDEGIDAEGTTTDKITILVEKNGKIHKLEIVAVDEENWRAYLYLYLDNKKIKPREEY